MRAVETNHTVAPFHDLLTLYIRRALATSIPGTLGKSIPIREARLGKWSGSGHP